MRTPRSRLPASQIPQRSTVILAFLSQHWPRQLSSCPRSARFFRALARRPIPVLEYDFKPLRARRALTLDMGRPPTGIWFGSWLTLTPARPVDGPNGVRGRCSMAEHERGAWVGAAPPAAPAAREYLATVGATDFRLPAIRESSRYSRAA